MGRQAHNDAPARHERPGGGRSGVFADEPTGNLDSKAGQALLEFLRGSVREFGQTVVMVTHDPFAASYADRVVLLADGCVAGQISEPTQDTVLDQLRMLGA